MKYQIKLRANVKNYSRRKLRGGVIIDKLDWTDIPKAEWERLRARDMAKASGGHRAPPEFEFRTIGGKKK